MKWLKWIGLLVAGLIICSVIWARLEYTAEPLFPHRRISITLPFSPENEAINLIPMGETIEHNFPGGHPGIDFQWNQPVPLIAVADGVITHISRADDKGEPVWYVTLQSGNYNATYKELEMYTSGLHKGSRLKQGDIIGYPHCHTQDGHTGCQVHWEFAYSSFFLPKFAGVPDRLCPMTYFDAAALKRINSIWDSISETTDRFKKEFPNICSNVFANLDQ